MAAELNTKTHSFTNRLGTLRKKYGLNITTGGSPATPKKALAKNAKASPAATAGTPEKEIEVAVSARATKRKPEDVKPEDVKSEDVKSEVADGSKKHKIKAESDDEESKVADIAGK